MELCTARDGAARLPCPEITKRECQILLLLLSTGMDPALAAPGMDRVPAAVSAQQQEQGAAWQWGSRGGTFPNWSQSQHGEAFPGEKGTLERGREQPCVPSQALLLLPPLLLFPALSPSTTHSPVSASTRLQGRSWGAAHPGEGSGHSSSPSLSLCLHSASPRPGAVSQPSCPGWGCPPWGPHPVLLRGKDALKAARLLAKVLKEIIACIKIFPPAKGLKPFP